MPPYSPVKSKSQSRALWAKAARGEVSEADARGKTDAADWSSLPERVKRATSSARGSKPRKASAGPAASRRREALRRAQRRGR